MIWAPLSAAIECVLTKTARVQSRLQRLQRANVISPALLTVGGYSGCNGLPVYYKEEENEKFRLNSSSIWAKKKQILNSVFKWLDARSAYS